MDRHSQADLRCCINKLPLLKSSGDDIFWLDSFNTERSLAREQVWLLLSQPIYRMYESGCHQLSCKEPLLKSFRTDTNCVLNIESGSYSDPYFFILTKTY